MVKSGSFLCLQYIYNVCYRSIHKRKSFAESIKGFWNIENYERKKLKIASNCHRVVREQTQSLLILSFLWMGRETSSVRSMMKPMMLSRGGGLRVVGTFSRTHQNLCSFSPLKSGKAGQKLRQKLCQYTFKTFFQDKRKPLSPIIKSWHELIKMCI